jgi:hypothetical protein
VKVLPTRGSSQKEANVFQAFVLKVLISSPGDTSAEVAAVKESLYGWNGSRAESAQVVLLPRHWKSDAVPRVGDSSGQEVINQELVNDADIVIALFDSRIGQTTAAAVSGTAEEIQRAIDAKKNVHVWFSNEPIPRDSDLKQLRALQKFRISLEKQGLLGQYDNLADLSAKVRSAVEADVTQLGLGSPQVPRRGVAHAIPRATRDGSSLVIENKSSDMIAEQFVFVCDTSAIALSYDGEPLDLLPDAKMSWRLDVFAQSPPQLTLTMQWKEGDEPQEQTQTISL